MTVIEEIAAERRRHIEGEGWSAEHDDGHEDGEMAMAAALYATPKPLFRVDVDEYGVQWWDPWPWNEMVEGARGRPGRPGQSRPS